MHDDDNIDVNALYRLRINKEPSTACPTSYYSDPAQGVKLVGESACGKCLYSGSGTKGPYCGRLQQWGVRCEFFRKVKR
jgi:hypothetical protein